MEDDKGLELSLGLGYGGGSSSTSKDRNGNPSGSRTDDDERTSKILNDFKNFLNPINSQENFFSNFPLAGTDLGNGSVVGEKRKSLFDYMNHPKKQEPDKAKTPNISLTTEDGSTAENEDVAESEGDGTSSRLVSHHEDGSKTCVEGGILSQIPKEMHEKSNLGDSGFGIKSINASNMPYSIAMKETPLPGMMQAMPSTSNKRAVTQNQGSIALTFGYSPVQLPVLDKDSSWAGVARSQPIQPSYVSGSLSTSGPMQMTNPNSFDATRTVTEQAKAVANPLLAEEGSSSHHPDEDAKSRVNTVPSEYPDIKPGISADVKFGGSGSFPNLPWVSTTGPGPTGRTISGVTFRVSATQIKIVCACHGNHLSPEEFIQHAGEEQPDSQGANGLAPELPTSNPAASA